ncbi:MAG TPA: acyl-CoA dehydratase activase [Pyrinomonadaceae bacterium]|nr:acyl-CoA dehydratase activase [Pyrinomonadaceae bacterium]
MRNVAGIDCGSGFTKAVIITERGANGQPVVLGRGKTKTGVNMEEAARRALDVALHDAGLQREQVSYVATTGFGRYGIGFRDIQITEITSGARGAYFLLPNTKLVLDIGSQSTRAMSLTENGKVKAFKSNDKCAAGSGSFIQRAAKYLEVGIEDVGELAMRATSPQPISSVCAVLAESEIINLVSTGLSVEDIMRGIYDSLADRAALLLKRVGSSGQLVFIGGVATQRGMVKALEDHLKVPVIVPSDCEYVCALGAALLGLKRCDQSSQALKSTSQMERPLERVV